jgi:hypothetical protein
VATDPATILASVEGMILKVTGGAQEYYVGTRRVRYPSLSELLDMRSQLLDELNIADQGGGTVLTVGMRVPPS